MLNKLIRFAKASNKTSRILKKFNCYLNSISDYYEFKKITKNIKETNLALSIKIQKCFKALDKENIKFGEWAVTKSALTYFLFYLSQENSNISILELGGGSSSIFWDRFDMPQLNMQIKTLEHSEEWYKKLNSLIRNKDKVAIFLDSLIQVSKPDRNELFMNPESSLKYWKKNGYSLENKQNENTKINNAFYSLERADFFKELSFNAVLMDGPHGNGRSLIFPLLYKYFKPNTLILIDDYDHHPYLDDLGRLFDFEVIIKSGFLAKKWIIVRLLQAKDL